MPSVFTPDAPAVLLGFARALRAAGVDAGPDRVQTYLTATAVLRPDLRAHLYWAGRLTLCGNTEDLVRYDRVFDAYFTPRGDSRRTARPAPPPARLRVHDGSEPPPAAAEDEAESPEPAAAMASSTEVLRRRDIADLTPRERAALNRLLAAFTLPGELRRSPRLRPARRGSVDPRRTVREMLRGGGEPARLLHRAPARKARRVVMLVDVSGSMTPYADALLRFAHAAAHGRTRGGDANARTDVFTLGTRLTRVTREMSHRDPYTALKAVGSAVPDWSGGTRLGEMLRGFLDRWGQRGMARGAVAVVLSDGWERGDPALLAAQMHRLHRLAHRVVWANPLKARPGYAPVAAGMAAALPHVDSFVEGHSLAALEHLAAVVRGAVDA